MGKSKKYQNKKGKNNFFRYVKIKYLPKGLWSRSVLIIVVPVLVLQLATATLFFNNHWKRIAMRLANNVVGEISTVVTLMHTFPGKENIDWIFAIAKETLSLDVTITPSKELQDDREEIADNILFNALAEALDRAKMGEYSINRVSSKQVMVQVSIPEGLLEVTLSEKKIFSDSVLLLVIMSCLLTIILFAISGLFMKNQVRSVARLAEAAESFGKGQDIKKFKPEGASEVRKAGQAFIMMRERIKKQMFERTQMLAGVSHDLRTPLTRMTLQLAMMGDNDDVKGLTEDVSEMKRMVDGYLSFAKGEGAEKSSLNNANDIVKSIVDRIRRGGQEVELNSTSSVEIEIRPNAFERCVSNIISNALRYADNAKVSVNKLSSYLEILVDDDGPGIPQNKRNDVFKPFFRIDSSRNTQTGGVGLGLTIAKDIVMSHGGNIELQDSPLGGLRVRILFPL